MNPRSLRLQLGTVFLGFLLLVLSAVTVTFWLVQTQQNDAAIINLAGRQRMLVQQMTRLALTEPENPQLAESAHHFEQTLTVLAEGGGIVDGNGRFYTLPPTTDSHTRAQLTGSAAAWPTFQTLLHAPVNRDALQTASNTLLVQLDSLVSAYEAQAQAKITRLRWMQIVFLAAAFLLLAWGYRIIHRQLIRPLTALDAAAQEIGAGHLDRPLPMLPENELGRLAQTMETMRLEIAAQQNSLAQQVAQRTQELTTAFQFSQEIVRELEPSQLLQSVANHTRELMQGEAVSVCILDHDGRSLELVASSGTGDQFLGLRQSTSRGIALPVIQEHKTVVDEGGCANCGFLHHFPGAFCATAPLQVGGRSMGALCVIRAQHPFSSDEARALTLLANAAAIALENARLIETSKQQVEENASLAERERLAANLHDNLAQNLGAMHLSVDQLAHDRALGADEQVQQHIAKLQRNLHQAYAQVRLALTGLREPEPDEDEFLTAVHTLLADFESQTGLPVQFVMEGTEEIRLTAVAQKQALHIIREALTNICRHAQAAHVQLTISQNDETVTLTIVDDGIGFDPGRVNSQHHLGLTIMRTRAERSQGQFIIRSAPGQGTQISATFLNRPAKAAEREAASCQ